MKLIVFQLFISMKFLAFTLATAYILLISYTNAFLKKHCSKKNRVCKIESSNPKEVCCKGYRCLEYFGFQVCQEGLKLEGESCASNEDCDSGKCDLASIPTKCLSNPNGKGETANEKKATVETEKQGRFQLCYYDEDCAFGRCIGSFRGVKFCNQ